MPIYSGKPRSKSLDAGSLQDSGVRLLQMRFTAARRAAGRTHLRDSPSPSPSLIELPEPGDVSSCITKRRGSVPEKEIKKSTGRNFFAHKNRRNSSLEKDREPILTEPKSVWVNEAGLVGQVVSSPYRHRRLSLQPDASNHPALLPCHKNAQKPNSLYSRFGHSGSSVSSQAISLPSFLFPSSLQSGTQSSHHHTFSSDKFTYSKSTPKDQTLKTHISHKESSSKPSVSPKEQKVFSPSETSQSSQCGVITHYRNFHVTGKDSKGDKTRKHIMTSCISYEPSQNLPQQSSIEKNDVPRSCRRGSEAVDSLMVSFMYFF